MKDTESGKVRLSLLKDIESGKVSDVICKASNYLKCANIPNFKQSL